MFDRRLLTHFDWLLLSLVLLVSLIGIANLYSATNAWELKGSSVYLKQLSWICVGVVIALIVCAVDYRKFEHLSFFFYAGNIVLLLVVLVAGKTSMGATRWIDLGFFNLQPSEVMKLVIIITLARYFSENAPFDGFGLKELGLPFLILGIPALLIIKQPDLGTSMMVLFIGSTMALFARIKRRTLGLLSLVAGFSCWGGWYLLHDYQRERIRTFLNPERDPLGSGYHIIQSKIAVGSGELFGKGFMQGTQSQLSFLPERHTDFAFSVFAEEWGFVGCMALIGLYLLIVLWGIYIARRAADRYGTYLALGVTAMFFWHVVVNLGMVIGLLPVVGVPLPLFSYGGTSMVTTMIGVGVLLNVSMRRFVF